MATVATREMSPAPQPVYQELRSVSRTSDIEVPLEQTPDASGDGLTVYEKKALLIDKEVDDQGMGRYQWMIFLLCGFGYFLDLLWAQMFAVIVSPIQNEFGFSDIELGNLATCFSIGLTVGALVWGILVDIIGRNWAFNFTVLTSSVFGLLLGVPNSYASVTAITAFVGFGIGGNIPIDTTITLECLPQGNRWLLPILSVFQPLGILVASALAYAFIPRFSCEIAVACSQVAPGEPCCTKGSNYGWRYLAFTLGGITMLIFILRFVLFRFQESPKYLLYRGRDEKAVEVLQYIAAYNKTECNITLESLTAISDDSSNQAENGQSMEATIEDPKGENRVYRLKDKARTELARFRSIFSTPEMTRLTILVWIIYMADSWGFTIAGAFLPTVLLRKGTILGLSLKETYLSYIYIYTFGIPGVVIGALIYGWRQTSLFLSSAIFGGSLFAFSAVNDEASNIGISGLVYFFQSMFNAILYGWTPEAYPAHIRGTSCGVASFWGRVVSIVAPTVAAHVLQHSLNGVLYLGGAGVFVASVAILFLPRKYMQKQVSED